MLGLLSLSRLSVFLPSCPAGTPDRVGLFGHPTVRQDSQRRVLRRRERAHAHAHQPQRGGAGGHQQRGDDHRQSGELDLRPEQQKYLLVLLPKKRASRRKNIAVFVCHCTFAPPPVHCMVGVEVHCGFELVLLPSATLAADQIDSVSSCARNPSRAQTSITSVTSN